MQFLNQQITVFICGMLPHYNLFMNYSNSAIWLSKIGILGYHIYTVIIQNFVY